jgi:hypothetical protein
LTLLHLVNSQLAIKAEDKRINKHIEAIVKLRNQIAHNSLSKLSQVEFDQMWVKALELLGHLGQSSAAMNALKSKKRTF